MPGRKPQTNGDPTAPEPALPADLRKALAAAPASRACWADLTPVGRRDFIIWIEGAKQPETRKKRIARTCDMVVSGKRRPCCFTIVPFDLHLAFKASPKAKSRWSALSATEKRDLVDWITSAKPKEVRQRRIHEGCARLAAGKNPV